MINIYQDKIVVLTASTSGIGYAMQLLFIKSGARVIAINRNQDLAISQQRDIKKRYPGARLTNINADLANVEQLPRLAQRIADSCSHIDFLLHNAGGIYPDALRCFNVNALSPFLLNNLLLPLLENAVAAKIVVSGSSARKMARFFSIDSVEYSPKTSPFNQYAYSKQCSYLLQALQQQWLALKSNRISIDVLDVPMTKTNMLQSKQIPRLFKALPFFFNSSDKTAAYILFASTGQSMLVAKKVYHWQRQLLLFAERRLQSLDQT